MKHIWKYLLSAAATLFFSGCLFYCLVAGAPQGKEELWIYLFGQAAFRFCFLALYVYASTIFFIFRKKLSVMKSQKINDFGSVLDKIQFVP